VIAIAWVHIKNMVKKKGKKENRIVEAYLKLGNDSVEV